MRKWMADKLFLYHWVRISILLFIYDVIVMNVSYGLALWLRFDFRFSGHSAGISFYLDQVYSDSYRMYIDSDVCI